jgi:hypothetical protein
MVGKFRIKRSRDPNKGLSAMLQHREVSLVHKGIRGQRLAHRKLQPERGERGGVHAWAPKTKKAQALK